MTKSGRGTICISVLPLQILGTCPPVPPWSTPMVLQTELATFRKLNMTQLRTCVTVGDQSSSWARSSEAQERLWADGRAARDVRGKSAQTSPGGAQRTDRSTRAEQQTPRQVSSCLLHNRLPKDRNCRNLFHSAQLVGIISKFVCYVKSKQDSLKLSHSRHLAIVDNNGFVLLGILLARFVQGNNKLIIMLIIFFTVTLCVLKSTFHANFKNIFSSICLRHYEGPLFRCRMS